MYIYFFCFSLHINIYIYILFFCTCQHIRVRLYPNIFHHLSVLRTNCRIMFMVVSVQWRYIFILFSLGDGYPIPHVVLYHEWLILCRSEKKPHQARNERKYRSWMVFPAFMSVATGGGHVIVAASFQANSIQDICKTWISFFFLLIQFVNLCNL